MQIAWQFYGFWENPRTTQMPFKKIGFVMLSGNTLLKSQLLFFVFAIVKQLTTFVYSRKWILLHIYSEFTKNFSFISFFSMYLFLLCNRWIVGSWRSCGYSVSHSCEYSTLFSWLAYHIAVNTVYPIAVNIAYPITVNTAYQTNAGE